MKRRNDRIVGAVLLCVIAAALGALLGAARADSASCQAEGIVPFTAPDNACTPGAWSFKTRTDVCDGDTARPKLRAAERRHILGGYQLDKWTDPDGELDHRVPLVLGGTTDHRNVWPERELNGANPKDRLEFRVYRRVCFADPHPMRVRTAIRLFLADWRHAYGPLVLGQGLVPR